MFSQVAINSISGFVNITDEQREAIYGLAEVIHQAAIKNCKDDDKSYFLVSVASVTEENGEQYLRFNNEHESDLESEIEQAGEFTQKSHEHNLFGLIAGRLNKYKIAGSLGNAKYAFIMEIIDGKPNLHVFDTFKNVIAEIKKVSSPITSTSIH